MENKDYFIKPGIFTEAHIYYPNESKGDGDEFLIPLEAVHFDKNKYLYKIEDGQAKKYEVETGKIIKDDVVIKKGLKKGDRIVVKNSRRLSEDQEEIEVY